MLSDLSASPAKKRLPFRHTNASVLLDLVRGLAAVLVLLEHVRHIFFVDYNKLSGYSTLGRHLLAVLYIVTSAGYVAVMLFFVLSGYFIGGSVVRALRDNTWSWKEYLIHRLVRLWIVLIPGLLACLFWDKVGLHSGFAPLTYHGIGMNHTTGDISRTLGPKIFLGNLFFLQGFFPVLGSDSALWTLAFEFWFYMLFPLGLLALRSEFPAKFRLLNAAGFALIIWFLHSTHIPLYFSVWLLGVALCLIPSLNLSVKVRWCVSVIYILIFFLFAAKHNWEGILVDFSFSLITSVFLWVMLSAHERVESSSFFAFGSRTLSKFSYTLYIVHLPLLTFLGALLLKDHLWMPTMWHLAEATGVFAILFAYTWTLASLTEFHTDVVRSWIERCLLGKSSKARS
jgi:peptidoglycan/LPS O-acetylase OafA/YrhL